ncbi:MAG: DnaJ domain-containing protein [Bacteroidota bacterium]
MKSRKEQFRILGLDETASLSQIKSAYRKLAKKYHPDVSKLSNARETFIEISEAYDYLIENEIEPDDKEVYRTSKAFKEKKEKAYKEWYDRNAERLREQAEYKAELKYKDFKKEELFQSKLEESLVKSAGCIISIVVAIFTTLILIDILDYFGLDYLRNAVIGISIFLFIPGISFLQVILEDNIYFKLKNYLKKKINRG